ncbi:unnamed protein product [Knipowitschia caucasica]
MTFKFLGWVKVFLILSACSHCTCVEVSIPEKQYEVAKGSDITLPCSFSPARPDYDMFILKWEVVQENKATIIATFYSNLNRIDISPTYEGRTSLDIGTSKQALLHLTKMTMADNANYRCTVLIPGDDEGTPSATTFLLVLVAPSPPVCKIQGTVEYWHDITLTCMSEEGSPKPLPDWKSYSVENVPRPFPPKTTEKDGALSLFNISREMSGFYVCTSTNRIGSASCNLTLSVFPGGSMSGATAGIIGGVVAGLLLLAVLIFCCYRNKKKAKYTEGSVGEMEYHDGDIQDPDGGQEDRMSNLQDRISEQIQNQKKTGMDKRDEDIESTAESHKSRRSQDRLDNYQDQDHHDDYRGSRDRLDNYQGRDRHDDYRGSRDRLGDSSRDHHADYRGSRDHLDNYQGRDHRDDYRGSRDHLDNYRGSRDRLGDSSRDRQDDYRGSRDRLDDYQGRDRHNDYQSRDRHGNYCGSRERLDDRGHRHGSRDHIDYVDS